MGLFNVLGPLQNIESAVDSSLNATIGSSRAARAAGTPQAMIASIMNSPMTAPNSASSNVG
jgi:hypothetical protein